MGRNTWSLSWSQEECLDLILAYQSQPVLWNTAHSSYFAKNVKQEGWEAIAIELDCPVEEIKAKINSLLGSYRRERRKVKSSIDVDGNARYRSRWYAYNHLEFLPELSETRELIAAKENVKEEVFVEESENMGLDPSPSDSESSVDNVVDTPVALPPPTSVKRKRNENLDEDPRIDEAFQILKKAATSSVCDECEAYGHYVSNKLKTYSDKVRAIVEYKINNILFEADMGNFDNINSFSAAISR